MGILDTRADSRYGTLMVMVRMLRHRSLRALFQDRKASKVRADQLRRLADVLAHLDTSTPPAEVDLTPVKNPPHPGHFVKDSCLDPLGLNVTAGAKLLGVARHTLSRVLNGQARISAEMAIRLEKAGWSNADHWLRLQTAYDLAQAHQQQS